MRERDLRFVESRIDLLRRRDRERDSESRKVEAEVFDEATLMAIYHLFSSGVIDTIEFPISTGKEAVVFTARTSNPPPALPDAEWLAVKIYRITNAEFRNLYRYIDGDPRFDNVRRDLRSIILAWARKEHKNLVRARDAGVSVPAPVAIRRNILVMEVVLDGERVAPMLKDAPPDDPGAFFGEVLESMRRLHRGARLVHADMSEYNILVSDGHPVLIDMGQAVVLEHPGAAEFLRRDAENLGRVFSRMGVDADPDAIMGFITGGRGAGSG